MSSPNKQPVPEPKPKPVTGKYAGFKKFLSEQREHPVSRTQHWAVDGRQRRSAMVARNLSGYTRGEARPNAKDRSQTADMLHFALNQLFFEAGLEIEKGDDDRHRLTRKISPDQQLPNANKRILNGTVLRLMGKRVTNATLQANMENTVLRTLDELGDGIDKDTWGEQIDPTHVKKLRDTWIHDRIDEGVDRKAASKHINNAGMDMVMRTPDLFHDYFDVDYGEFLEKGDEVVPDDVYTYVDTLLRLPEAHLDILADIADLNRS